MRPYPCLEIDDAKLSLVYPYTLNDRIITEFYFESYQDFNINDNLRRMTTTTIRIYNDEHKAVCFTLNDDMFENYRRECERICRSFRYNYSSDARIYEADFRDLERHDYFDCFNLWIQGCKEQARDVDIRNNRNLIYSSYDRVKSTLIRQGRGDTYTRVTDSSVVATFENGSTIRMTNVSDARITDTTNNINEVIQPFVSFDRSRTASLTGTMTMSSGMVNILGTPVKFIHPHNYIPEYQKWYVNGEDSTNTLLLGAEIEVDEGGETDDTAAAVLKIIHGSDEAKEDYMFAVHDGSLNKGIEFVTMPCSLEYHKKLPYREMFKYLDEHGYKGHDSKRAGLHIHINRDFFRNISGTPKSETIYVHKDYFNGMEVQLPEGTDINSVKVYDDNANEVTNRVSDDGYYIFNNILVLPKGYKNRGKTYTVAYIKNVKTLELHDSEQEYVGKLMYIIEKFEDEMSAISRRNCTYAKLLGYNGEKCKEMYSKGYKVRNKYNAVNLLHKDTIEIRIFKSTLKYETFINTLEFVSKLAYFVKDHSEDEVENMTWNDLFETFSDDLKSYYLQRKEIEDKKKAEKEVKIDPLYNMFITSRDIALDDRNIIEHFSVAHDGLSNNMSRVDFNGQEFNGIRSFNVSIDEHTSEIIDHWNSAREASFTCEMSNLEALSQLWNEILRDSGELQTVDAIKKRIRDIKQKMKHTGNYMEKVKLQSELNESQQALKKAKAAKKRNTETN